MESDSIGLLVFLISIVVAAFAVAVEMALTMTNRNEIRKMSEDGNAHATSADRLLQEPDRLFLTSMLLRTAALVAAGAAAVGVLPGAATVSQMLIAIAITWAVFALIQVLGRAVVGRWAQQIALRGAWLMRAFSIVLWPAYILLRQVSVSVGGDSGQQLDEHVFLSEEGLRLLIDVGDEEPILDSEKEMIENILEMDETVAREVMVPRIDVVAMEVQTSLRDALNVVIEAGHSRIPVFEENIDRIVGFLYAKDLLHCFQENRDDMPISTLLRPVYFVPESKKVNALLREMQKRRVHVAMVVDEYGGTAGLVTIEDIIEEIFGEIQDEYDEEEDIFVESIDDGKYLLNARYDLYSLSKLLDIEVSQEDADTLGGLLYSVLGHVPDQGESVDVAGWRFTVLSLDGRRIDQVRAEPVDERGEGDTARTATDPSTSQVFKYSLMD